MAAVLPGTRERLIRFYEVYAPDKVKDVDRLITLFVGKEEATFGRLVAKYGPEPSNDVGVAGASPESLHNGEGTAAARDPVASDSSQPSCSPTTDLLGGSCELVSPAVPLSTSVIDDQRCTEHGAGNADTVAPSAVDVGEPPAVAVTDVARQKPEPDDKFVEAHDRSEDLEEFVVEADMYEDDIVNSFAVEHAWSLPRLPTHQHSTASQTSDFTEALPSESTFVLPPVLYRSSSEVEEAWDAFTRRIAVASSPAVASVGSANPPPSAVDAPPLLLHVAMRLQRVCRGYSERRCLRSVALWIRRAFDERRRDGRCARQRSTVADLLAHTEQLVLRCYAVESRQAECQRFEAHRQLIRSIRAQRLEAHRNAKDIAQTERHISRELSQAFRKLHQRNKAADRRTANDWARLVEASYVEGQQRQRHQAYVEAHRRTIDQLLRSPDDGFGSVDDFAMM